MELRKQSRWNFSVDCLFVVISYLDYLDISYPILCRLSKRIRARALERNLMMDYEINESMKYKEITIRLPDELQFLTDYYQRLRFYKINLLFDMNEMSAYRYK